MTTLVLIHGALRRHDNPLLAHRAGETVFYAVHDMPTDPTWPASSHRLRFISEGIQAFADELTAHGHRLAQLTGDTVAAVTQWVTQCGIDTVRCVDAPGFNERQFMKRLRRALSDVGCRLEPCATQTLLAPSELGCALADLPTVFTRCRHHWEGMRIDPQPRAITTHFGLPGVWPDDIVAWCAPSFDDSSAPRAVGDLPFHGSEASGLARVARFMAEDGGLFRYKETRNGLDGALFSSQLSPWLATGALSPRTVWAAVRAQEQAVRANESTYWMLFELLWREFFHWHCRRAGAAWFSRRGLLGPNDFRPARCFGAQKDAFEAWTRGETGEDFVDANMRLLAATGWMSNRGRQCVASYFIHDLGIDWRLGAAWFESQLIDYDAASNWGNWAYIAGVGHDPRGGRAFNLRKQAETHDPEGRFRARWLSERGT